MPLPKKIEDLIPLLGLVPHPEGGFFVETHRSGCDPMSTLGQSGYDCHKKDLVVAHGRDSNRDDGDARRNCLTSIFWVASALQPTRLVLATNCSDHVHYYQGGRPFQYLLYDPVSEEYSEQIVGPELHKGHKLQFVVPGGVWKCGTIVVDDPEPSTADFEYSLIGEGVAPGWDAGDFELVTEEMVVKELSNKNEIAMKRLLPFLHKQSKELRSERNTSEFMQEEITKSVECVGQAVQGKTNVVG